MIYLENRGFTERKCFEDQVILRRSTVRADYKKRFIASVTIFLLMILAACGSTPTPVVETAKATREVVVEVIATGDRKSVV